MQPLEGIAVRGVVGAVPTRVARSADYTPLSEAERAKFAAGTGIDERRIVDGGQCTSDLCLAAAETLLARLGWERDSVEALVLITQTGDHPVPATAIVLQHKLGLPTSCAAFDINLGCSSYPYGLAVVGGFMRSLGLARALLLVGDVSSRLCSYDDKSAWPLFGDAGTATALERDASAEPMHFDLRSDGAGKDAIIVPAGGLASRQPATADSFAPRDISAGIARHDSHLVLKGADIFSFAIREVPPSIQRCAALSGWAPHEVDFVVLHQANKMINDFIRKKTGFSERAVLSTLRRFGNTSSASIPLTLAVHGEQLGGGARLLLSGFGVGLSWASASLVLQPGTVLELVESDDVH